MDSFLRWYDIDSIDNMSAERVEWMLRWLKPVLTRYFRSEVRGIERVPPGAGLYVGNHNSGMMSPDSFIFGGALFEAHGVDAVPYGLAHEVPIRMPLLHQIIVPVGAVRASHENAHRLFARGKKILVYPGGDLDAMRPFRHRNRIVFGGRRGYIRLALTERVPIIPVVAAGAHSTYIVLDDMRWLASALRLDRIFRTKVWPLTLSIPWGLTLGPLPFFIPYPTRILIEVLEPIRFRRAGARAARDDEYVRACAERVESAMQAALDRLVEDRNAPRSRRGGGAQASPPATRPSFSRSSR